jgi:hypothetical protein
MEHAHRAVDRWPVVGAAIQFHDPVSGLDALPSAELELSVRCSDTTALGEMTRALEGCLVVSCARLIRVDFRLRAAS